MKRKVIGLMLALTMACGALGGCGGKAEKAVSDTDTLSFDVSGVTATHTIGIDGEKALTADCTLYEGLGFISANNSSRLLLDYKAENPEAYNELLEYVFGKDGMNISLLKIEMGADIDSSSGTEPAVKRSADEIADVTRGAGYQLAADAIKVNPDLEIDMLYWGIPAWVNKAEDSYAALYQWYKETIDALYDTYGVKVTYVTATQNEKFIDTEWIKYLSKALKSETDGRYDYSEIKIVAGESVSSWSIANLLVKDEELIDCVDVMSAHYTSWTNDNAIAMRDEHGKKVWFSEGSSPMSNAAEVYKYDGTGSGMSDINGMLDIATRITQAFAEGMTMYEFQPAVSSYYDGVTYFPKQLITANEPWSGKYTFDTGFYMCLHFSQFIEKGWQMIDGACYGDGVAGGDGHAIVDSTYNYITYRNPETDDYSVVIVNNSAETISYEITVTNLAKSAEKVYVWQTKGPGENEDYFSNFFKKLGSVAPTEGENGMTYTVVVEPYSMMTLSTLDVEEKNYTDRANEGKVLEYDYTDDFEYADYPDDYLASRGYAPRYTTDQSGAFEVSVTDSGNVLRQVITADIKAKEWAYSGDPTTNFGDDRWRDYTFSADVLIDVQEESYVGIGVRYILADNNQSGYWLKVDTNGVCDLMKNGTSLAQYTISGFDAAAWHKLSVTAIGNVIKCAVDDEDIIEYTEEGSFINSGRVALYSSYNNNCFDNVLVTSAKGEDYVSRFDNFNSCIAYSDGSNAEDGNGWYFNTMCSYKNFGRTLAVGSRGDSFTFNYTGGNFALIASGEGTLSISVDGGEKFNVDFSCTNSREAIFASEDIADGEHTVTVEIFSGDMSFDALEIA